MFTIPGLLASLRTHFADAWHTHKLSNQITKPTITGFDGTRVNFWQLDPVTAGAVNRNADDRGLICLMKPSDFLRLAEKDDATDTDPDQIERYRERITHGLPMASPSLSLRLENDVLRVLIPDGRQRAQAIAAAIGDRPIPVILYPMNGREGPVKPSFNSPNELRALLHDVKLVGRNGALWTKDELPFNPDTVRFLHYKGDFPSTREHDAMRGSPWGPFGPMGG